MDDKLWQALNDDSPRARRAHRTADTILHLVRDFTPTERRCLDSIREHLLEAAYQANAEIINVPPECDALDKLQLERLRLETHHAYVTAEKII
jgi:hypothetical protein